MQLGMQIKRLFLVGLIPVFLLVLGTQALAAEEGPNFAGNGTREDPYLIASLEELQQVRDAVLDGNSYEGCYFLQTENIDMLGEEWVPIGLSGAPFGGVYDGGGHYVENLYVTWETTEESVSGLFGYVSGVIANLGVESGTVEGIYCGSVASRAVGDKAAILNCYSKATVYGMRAGGIAENFSGNVVACCWYSGNLTGADSQGLLASGGDVKLYHCYTTAGVLAPEDVDSPTSAVVAPERLGEDSFIRNLNLSVGLAQYLYASGAGVTLKQWELGSEGTATFSEETGYLLLFRFISLYLLPLLLLLLAVVILIAWRRSGTEKFWQRHQKEIHATAIISGITALFLDTAAMAKGADVLCVGNISFLVLVHVFFVGAICLSVRFRSHGIRLSKAHIPLICAIVFVVALEVIQFQLVPHFDAHLYYGSFVKGCNLFRLDLISYIGDFVYWKWAQGLALLIAPFEFLLPGKMIGVYLSNVIITIVTMCCTYWLLRKVSPRISPLLAALGGTVLMLCPYQLGLFTYLSMDNYTALFLVWLLCSYQAKNPMMVSFCGYLLAFNKITGLVFYVFFLLMAGLIELIQSDGKNLLHKIPNWWSWKQVLLWVLPAVLYLASTFVADDLTTLCFYGSYTEATIGLKDLRGLANTGLQAFVYGFRWVLTGLTIVALVLLLFRRRRLTDVLTGEGCRIFGAMVAGCAALLVVLCIYRGDAECPRYTAPLNVYYALALPILLTIIFPRRMATALSCFMTMLLLVQLFWTIDPVILLTCESIDTGKKQIYKLALPDDPRTSMKLGTDYGRGIEVLGDLYVYNLEHTFYDDLLDDMLQEIDPSENTQFVLLDVIDYELHMYGNHYRIYWDAEAGHRTYDGFSSASIFLGNEKNVTTDQLVAQEVSLDDTFYLLVPARVPAKEAIAALEAQGYTLDEQWCYSNLYGMLYTYQFSRTQ